jgi:hypothetical protein
MSLSIPNTELGRFYAIVVHGIKFKFYEYHQTLPAHARLIPWGPLNQRQPRNSFHARNVSFEIDWMLRYMVQNDIPPVC